MYLFSECALERWLLLCMLGVWGELCVLCLELYMLCMELFFVLECVLECGRGSVKEFPGHSVFLSDTDVSGQVQDFGLFWSGRLLGVEGAHWGHGVTVLDTDVDR